MKKHIMIIDDNTDICEVIQMLLEMEGYFVTARMTGKDSVDVVKKLTPDLILLDVMLDDGYNGLEICKVIKQTEATHHIPVVIISATHTLTEAIQQDCRPNDFISKPFDIDNLIDVVESQLKAA
jgi:CheY-like chemotaxis protein